MGLKLKSIRVRCGITQQALAEKLEVSQQTVARWESAAGAIPSKYLKDLAVLFGGRVADFIDDDPDSKVRQLRQSAKRTADNAEDEPDLPYGDVQLTFNLRSPEDTVNAICDHSYPITVGERSRILSQLENDLTGDGDVKWIEFRTLDCRWVLVNALQLGSISLVADEVEAITDYEHEEVYKALRETYGAPEAGVADIANEDFPYSPQLIAKVKALEMALGDDGVIEAFECVTYEFVGGRRQSNVTEDSTLSELVDLFEDPRVINRHTFVDLHSEGYYRSTNVRLDALQLIEVPLLRLQEWQKNRQDDQGHGRSTEVS